MEENTVELKEKVVAINRVAKVVKGGRTFRFSAVVVVGDGNGHVGVGNGKAAEVPDAIKKAIEDAKKNLVEVPIVGTTIPHEFVGQFGSANVLLKPAAEGTGIIAGGSVRPVIELAGYRDIRTKVLGTNNPRNVVYATIEGLKKMQTIEQVAKKRGKKVIAAARLKKYKEHTKTTICCLATKSKRNIIFRQRKTPFLKFFQERGRLFQADLSPPLERLPCGRFCI